MMKNLSEALAPAVSKLLLAIVSAAIIGGGTAIIANASTDAVQDQRLNSLEADRAVMRDLSDKLDETNKNVAVLNERLERVRGK